MIEAGDQVVDVAVPGHVRDLEAVPLVQHRHLEEARAEAEAPAIAAHAETSGVVDADQVRVAIVIDVSDAHVEVAAH